MDTQRYRHKLGGEAREKSEKNYQLIEKVKHEHKEHGKHLEKIQPVFDGMRYFIVGHTGPTSRLAVGVLSRGQQNPQLEDSVKENSTPEKEHFGISAPCLLLGNPGLAKTVMCDVLGGLCGGSAERIQGSPEIEPGDILGKTVMFGEGLPEEFRPGPIFANHVLVDEFNRVSEKTQAALIEPLAEGRVTANMSIGKGTFKKRTFDLPRPFFFAATQNPLDHRGVFTITEALLDRIAMQINVGGLTIKEVIGVVQKKKVYAEEPVRQVIEAEDILACQNFIAEQVEVAVPIIRYAAILTKLVLPYSDLLDADRETDKLFNEAKQKVHNTPLVIGKEERKLEDVVAVTGYTRGAQVIISLAQTQAFLQGRRYVFPEDIQKMFPACMAHRIAFHLNVGSIFSRQKVTDEKRPLNYLELQKIVTSHVLRHTPIVFDEDV